MNVIHASVFDVNPPAEVSLALLAPSRQWAQSLQFSWHVTPHMRPAAFGPVLSCMASCPPAAGQLTMGAFVLRAELRHLACCRPGCTGHRLCLLRLAHLSLSPSLYLASCLLLCPRQCHSHPGALDGTAFALIADEKFFSLQKNFNGFLHVKRYHTTAH